MTDTENKKTALLYIANHSIIADAKTILAYFGVDKIFGEMKWIFLLRKKDHFVDNSLTNLRSDFF